MGLVDNANIELPCKNCGRKTKKSIAWVNANRQFTCTCGSTSTLDTRQLKAELTKVDAAFALLQKSLKKFNK